MTTRRQFLTSLGLGTYALLRGSQPGSAAPLASPRRKGKPPAFFEPILPQSNDSLVLPKGFEQYSLVVKWGDPLGSRHQDFGPEHFGFNNDFTCYFPINARECLKDPSLSLNSDEGLLWVNHEYPHPLFVSGYEGKGTKTAAQITLEKLSVGGSILRVKRTGESWAAIPDPAYTRRFTALYPEIALTGPASQVLPSATGTLANCSGGRTPWMTVLSCEENYPDFNAKERPDQFRWADVPEMAIDERGYGWIVEVDPYGELPPQKHTALGRFKHENAAVCVGPQKKLVVYMGDDEADQFLYKYVSKNAYDPKASRAENRKLLTEGTLYAADFSKGVWLPLDLEKSKALRDAEFGSQAEVMMRTRAAAAALKATPLDRCEDCEIHPKDGSLYVSLTNNKKHGNLYGHIVRLVEDDDNPEGTKFQFEIFLAGGPQSGLACPDNLAFDKQGNLWVVCDISSESVGKDAYRPYKNNGLFVVPTSGPSLGDAFQFASGPKDAELTGPWFTDDYSTLFLSVQHPGEETRSLDKLTSNWPGGIKGDLPKPSVVAIRGFQW